MWQAMWVTEGPGRTDPIVYAEICRRWLEYGKTTMKSDVDMFTDGNSIWFTKQDDVAMAFILGFTEASKSFNFTLKRP